MAIQISQLFEIFTFIICLCVYDNILNNDISLHYITTL